MEKHYGEIIETTIRRNGYSISELSRMMSVNRRSIYNWFDQPKIRPETIFKIGVALRHDFSIQFPELFSSEDFQREFEKKKNGFAMQIENTAEISFWKDKYIMLLEQYNSALSKQQEGTVAFA